MTKDELNDEYLEWMLDLATDFKRSKKEKYRELLTHLHRVVFTYMLPMDGNRAEDGVDLRYRFGYEKHYDDPIIATYLDRGQCSVLEMMVALSMRCEETIMDDPDIGDRTGKWCWDMIANLGLGGMTNDRFDVDYVDNTLSRFMRREYARNGKGGLFTVESAHRDLRNVEIWYQMCWHLNEIM